MSVETQIPSLNVAVEKRALHTCIERMRRLLSREDATRSSLRISVGEASLLVDAEHAALARGGLSSPGGKLESLVLRTLGWQAKTQHDLSRVDGELSPASAGRLLFDVASSRLLDAEFDAVCGRKEKFLASRWEKALQVLWRQVRELSAKAGDQLDPEGIEELRTRLLERDLWTPESPPVIDSPAAPSRRGRRKTRGRGRRVFGRTIAVAILLILVGSFSYVSMNYHTWMNRPESGILDSDSFAQLPSVLGFEDRPPSVLVTVDAVAWTRLDDSGRAAVVSSIRRIVENEGYSGALLYTQSGTVVAQWSEKTGTSFFD